jgi:hypothetical protein
MRDTCGLLIAGQGAARGHRRATGDEQGSGRCCGKDLQSSFHGYAPKLCPWLLVSDTNSLSAEGLVAASATRRRLVRGHRTAAAGRLRNSETMTADRRCTVAFRSAQLAECATAG